MQKSGKLIVKVANQIIKSYDSPARMEGEMCISHLPEEILQYIASFLSPHDVTRLSMTCHQIKKILPVFLHKNGPDINQLGPRDGHWTPEFYFNSPKFTSRPKKVTISMRWNDQVNIKQKLLLFINLISFPSSTKILIDSFIILLN